MSPARCVVTLAAQPTARVGHDRLSRGALAERLAAVLGYAFGGEYDARRRYPARLYFVPKDTLLREQADALGIRDEHDLFGGVVPHRFIATKAITHAALDDARALPPRWSPALAEALRGVVLPGFSAFAADDVQRAAARLLALGRVRIKPAHAIGGAGQHVVADTRAVDATVAQLDPQATAEHGVVIELDIDAARTLSVGELHVGATPLAYFGLQRTVADHRGDGVYGGSDLTLVRGDFGTLARHAPDADTALAIEQARAYDAAIGAAFPDFFASRRNYDVLQGHDRQGEFVSGVLEQSWRLGGASPAEIAALEAFKGDKRLSLLRARSVETYGDEPLPPDALVHYDGSDAVAGRLRKYVQIEPPAPR